MPQIASKGIAVVAAPAAAMYRPEIT